MIAVTEVRVAKDRKAMTVAFADGLRAEISAELLRVMSPSAEVQGHSAATRKLVSGKKDVQIAAVEPVGNYAVRITFDDLHSTGIYSWAWLRDMAENRETKWAAYLAELEEKGLSR